jgi:acyl-CoA synthetase (AMP-forming)/AMP-acid ligase II
MGEEIRPSELVGRLHDFVMLPPDRDFVESGGRWWRAADVAAVARGVEGLLEGAGVSRDTAVGVVVRNHVEQAAALIGLIAAGRPVTMIQSQQASSLIADQVRALELAVVIAEESDWDDDLRAGLAEGRMGIVLPVLLGAPRLAEPVNAWISPRRRHDQTVVEVLTSGTTGPPKHVALGLHALIRGVAMLTLGGKIEGERQVDILFAPLTSIGGILPLMAYPVLGASFCLLERFDVEQWVEAIQRHRPQSVGTTPVIIRSVLQKGVPREALSSLKIVYGGAGPLEQEFRQRFAESYDVDLCWGYGATEFAGMLATWTPQLKQELGGDKPGSVGRPLPGIAVRITDVETDEELATHQEGRLEAKVPGVSENWLRTNDLAKIDDDGIIYILGRIDGAINRGGFKVLPEIVADALRRHPSVKDAGVIGMPEPRLGEVPVAAVELKPLGDVVTGKDLRAFTRRHLASPSVPAEVIVVEALPRNGMMKVDLAGLRRLFESMRCKERA